MKKYKYLNLKTASLLGLSLFISCYNLKEPKLPLIPQQLNSGWERITIEGVGFIDIPPSMEIQSGDYKDFADNIKNDNNTGISDIVIQTKGANNWEEDGLKKYARILLKTHLGSPGDFVSLNSQITKKDLKGIPEIDQYMKIQISESFAGTRLSLLEWKGTMIEKINGMTCFNYCYTRKLEGKSPVMVSSYIFQNNDRSHHLTISYRISESELWKADLDNVLKSFRITNIR